MTEFFPKIIILYAVVAVGLTEAIMRVTPKKVTRRFAPITALVVANIIAQIHGVAMGVAWQSNFWPGVLAAGLAAMGYDHLKVALAGIISKMKPAA